MGPQAGMNVVAREADLRNDADWKVSDSDCEDGRDERRPTMRCLTHVRSNEGFLQCRGRHKSRTRFGTEGGRSVDSQIMNSGWRVAASEL